MKTLFDDFVSIYFPWFMFSFILGGFVVQVYEFVGLTELYYAGSHGMDIVGPVRHSTSDDHPNCIESTDMQVNLHENLDISLQCLHICP
jgi:hypothetical protein